jgi:hypothetical protein
MMSRRLLVCSPFGKRFMKDNKGFAVITWYMGVYTLSKKY